MEILAKNIGQIALNFEVEIVKKSLYPIFQQFVQDKISSLRNLSAESFYSFLEIFKGHDEFKALIDTANANYLGSSSFQYR